MKPRILAAIAVLAVAALVGGARTTPGANGVPAPSLAIDSTTHDFGELLSDAKVEYRWPIRNEGNAVLEIINVFPSCGCTASLIETKGIPPGGSGSLLVTFDATGQHGDVRKSIAVVTNDPERSRLLLTVLAKVLPPKNPRVSKGHPATTGQSYLVGDCATCHAAPAAGKRGEDLWNSVCAMCHGARGEGKLAPSLRNAEFLAGREDRELHEAIAYGTTNPRMPGFSKLMGGPLDEAQIGSLVRVVRAFGSESSPPKSPPK